MLTRTFHPWLCLYLVLAFICFTIIGTLSHESGHFLAAEMLGYDAEMNYGTTFYEDGVDANDAWFITLCGPLQTMITGTIGFMLLLFYRRNFFSAQSLNFRQWLLIFFSLFWLREVFNFLFGMLSYAYRGKFPVQGDEFELAASSGFHPLSFILPATCIACVVLAFVLFRFIPGGQRVTFLVSGLIGGPLGFYLWFGIVGPAVMP